MREVWFLCLGCFPATRQISDKKMDECEGSHSSRSWQSTQLRKKWVQSGSNFSK